MNVGNRTNHSPEFLANRWQSGKSGNPLGRPKHQSFEDVVRGILAEKIPGTDTDKLEALARVVLDEALSKRNTQVIRLLADRLWPATKTIDLEVVSHEEPRTVKLPRTIEQMRETLRIVGEVIDVDPVEVDQ